MLTTIWLLLIYLSIATAALTGRISALTPALIESAKSAVDLAIGLIGSMTFFLGLMQIAKDAGVTTMLAKIVRPLLVKLFPDVPTDHPAIGSILMNIVSNMLGLTNAATPFGLKAMSDLNQLNRNPGVATDAMVMLLAINTSGVALLPTGVIALRASAGSSQPAAILVTTLIATCASTLVGIASALLLSRFFSVGGVRTERSKETGRKVGWRTIGGWLLLLGLIVALLFQLFTLANGDRIAQFQTTIQRLSDWGIPALVLLITAIGIYRRVKLYESMIEGAKEGWNVAVKIIPYLVAIVSAIGMFRASGALDLFVAFISPLTNRLAIPAEVVPLMIVRPLSGSGAFAMLADLLKTHGADSFVGLVSSTVQGSTDTTFYILAVYFGSVGIYKIRHALVCGLLADAAGFLGAIGICHLAFSGIADHVIPTMRAECNKREAFVVCDIIVGNPSDRPILYFNDSSKVVWKISASTIEVVIGAESDPSRFITADSQSVSYIQGKKQAKIQIMKKLPLILSEQTPSTIMMTKRLLIELHGYQVPPTLPMQVGSLDDEHFLITAEPILIDLPAQVARLP